MTDRMLIKGGIVLTQDPVSLLLLRGRRGPLPGPDLVRPPAACSSV